MIDSNTQNLLLRLYPMLRNLPAAQLDVLLFNATAMKVPAGTVMFDENQACQGFPLLLSGNIRVIKASANGRELQLYRVCPGESCILTSSCLLGHTPYQPLHSGRCFPSTNRSATIFSACFRNASAT